MDFDTLVNEYSVVVMVVSTILVFLLLVCIWKVISVIFINFCCKKHVRRPVDRIQDLGRHDLGSCSSLPPPPFPRREDNDSMEDVELFNAATGTQAQSRQVQFREARVTPRHKTHAM